MSPETNIRPMRPSDIETVVEISLAAWQSIYEQRRRTMGDDLFAAVHPDWRAEKERQVRRGCASGTSAILAVAQATTSCTALAGEEARSGSTQVVGFVTCYVLGSGIGEIGNNAVHPDWRGQGIAPRLYEYAFDRLRERGVRYVKVGTGGDPAHAPARRAYEKAGFEIALPGVEYYRKL
jgi:ribosomal protein S18 acetylase RimI-like enzyme